MTRIVMVVLALCACGQTMWFETRASTIKRGDQAFVVTNGRAFLLDVTASDQRTIEGRAARVWTFEPHRFRVRAKDTPDVTAYKLGWQLMPRGEAPYRIAWRDVLYVSREQGPDPAQPVEDAVSFVGVVAATLALMVLGVYVVVKLR